MALAVVASGASGGFGWRRSLKRPSRVASGDVKSITTPNSRHATTANTAGSSARISRGANVSLLRRGGHAGRAELLGRLRMAPEHVGGLGAEVMLPRDDRASPPGADE